MRNGGGGWESGATARSLKREESKQEDLVTKMLDLYRKGQPRPWAGVQSRGQGMLAKGGPVTGRDWKNLAVRAQFDMLNRHLGSLSQV